MPDRPLIKVPTDNPYIGEDQLMYLDGEIGKGKCDHDACVCGESYIDAYGYPRSAVEHSGQWKVISIG